MTERRLRKLLKASNGETLSEDDDTDVSWLVAHGFLNWNDDDQTHEVTDKGRQAITRAVESANKP